MIEFTTRVPHQTLLGPPRAFVGGVVAAVVGVEVGDELATPLRFAPVPQLVAMRTSAVAAAKTCPRRDTRPTDPVTIHTLACDIGDGHDGLVTDVGRCALAYCLSRTRPTLPLAPPVNQMLPSVPVVMPKGVLFAVGTSNRVS